MTAAILWTPQDTGFSKKRQRGISFPNFISKNTEEKILFNQKRSSESTLLRTRSHLNYFTKLLQKNVYQENFDIKSEHFNIDFATNDSNENLCQLDQKTIAQKLSICIIHFKLDVIKLEEEIAIHKDKLRNVCDGERLTFLQNKINQFKGKLYKELEKIKHNKLNKHFYIYQIYGIRKTNGYLILTNLNLTNQHRLSIKNNEEIDDFIILQAMNLLRKQYPSITTQPPSLTFSTGYSYCPSETV